MKGGSKACFPFRRRMEKTQALMQVTINSGVVMTCSVDSTPPSKSLFLLPLCPEKHSLKTQFLKQFLFTVLCQIKPYLFLKIYVLYRFVRCTFLFIKIKVTVQPNLCWDLPACNPNLSTVACTESSTCLEASGGLLR